MSVQPLHRRIRRCNDLDVGRIGILDLHDGITAGNLRLALGRRIAELDAESFRRPLLLKRDGDILRAVGGVYRSRSEQQNWRNPRAHKLLRTASFEEVYSEIAGLSELKLRQG